MMMMMMNHGYIFSECWE